MASAPTRKASSGMDPPPAKGSTTRGRVPGSLPRDSWAACVRAGQYRVFICRVVQIGEVGDEIQEYAAQFLGVIKPPGVLLDSHQTRIRFLTGFTESLLGPQSHQLPCLIEKPPRTNGNRPAASEHLVLRGVAALSPGGQIHRVRPECHTYDRAASRQWSPRPPDM